MKSNIHILKISLFSVCLLFFEYSFGQRTNYTELGLNYFLNNIYSKDFSESKLEFSGFTESKMPEFVPIFRNADSIVNQIFKKAEISEFGIELKLNQSKKIPKIRKHRGKNIAKLVVYPHGSYDEKHYVYIVIYKPYHFVEHYLIELNELGKPTNYWNTGEII